MNDQVIAMESPDKAREELEKILSQREYQIYYENQDNLIQSWWKEIQQWFNEIINTLFFGFEPSSGVGDTLLLTLIGIVVLLVLFAGFLIVRTIIRKRTFREQKPFQSVGEMEWSVLQHLKEAKKQEDEQNYSLATRHQFLALLLHFHERNWLTAHIWKTNWDYVNELQKENKERATAFYELAQTFDEVFYGDRMIEHQEYVNYQKQIEKWLNDSRADTISEL